MLTSRTITPLFSAAVLAGCIPYSGTTSDGAKCYDYMFALSAYYSKGGTVNEDCLDARPKNIQPAHESTKHVFFTEEERLKIAEDAARLMYPFNNQKFAYADKVSGASYSKHFGVDGSRLCNAQLAKQRLTQYIYDNKQLPEGDLYRAIAKKWSSLFSDDQIKQIQAYVDLTNQNKDVSIAKEQLPEGMYVPSTIYGVMRSYADENVKEFSKALDDFYADIEAEKLFSKKSVCSGGILNGNYSSGYHYTEDTPRFSPLTKSAVH